MRKSVSVLLLLMPLQVLCQSKLPASDIWMMQIDFKGGNILFSNPKNLTGEKGYENQPCYSKDGSAIYYTVQGDNSLTTAIYSYALSTDEKKQITFTSLSP